MSIKRALVVDDSRSARLVLRRLLENHGLDVETAESAEEALEYLKSESPDVIFMDHTMPGMDGLQAVTVIKNDPKTAMIPVMMYTAKEGELYVGQARALGAVGVLPKHVEPAEVFKVLERLGLVTDQRRKPGEGKPPSAPGQDGKDKEGEEGQPGQGGEEGQEARQQDGAPPGIALEGLVGRMLCEQRLELRTDILASHRALAREVAQEVLAQQRVEQTGRLANSKAEAAIEPEPPQVRTVIPTSWMLFTLVLLASIAWLLWNNNQAAEKIDLLEQAAAEERVIMEARMESRLASSSKLSRGQIDTLQARSAVARDQIYRLLATVEWATNENNSIAFSEEALGRRRLVMIEGLLQRLDNLNYKGVLRLETHLGRFCLIGDEAQGYALAEPELAVDQCTLIGHPLDDSLSVAGRESLEFTNFLDSSAVLEAGSIEVEIVHHGREGSRELFAYPRSGGFAAEWNRVAARNNRLEIELLPDPDWPYPSP